MSERPEERDDAGFEVVDRRRVRADAAAAGADGPEAQAPPPPAPEDPGAEEPFDPGQFNPFGGLTALTVLHTSVELLSERAWIAMGLVADPASGKVEPDFADAQLAIDVLADLLKHLEPHLDPAGRREAQARLMDLRLNFVRQKTGSGP